MDLLDMDYFNYHRRKSSEVKIGKTPLGGNNPIRIQSMTNTSTMDTLACVEQSIRIIEAGPANGSGGKGGRESGKYKK